MTELPRETADDELLAVRFRDEGDQAAFVAFIEAQRSWLDAAAWAWARGDADAAADLRQEAVAALYAALGKFRGRSRVRTFAWRVVRNAIMTRLRSEGRRKRREARAAALEVPTLLERQRELDPAGTFDSDSAESEYRAVAGARMRAALARLGEKDRTLLSLRSSSPCGIAALAALMGLREGTVRTRLSRARRRLEAAYEEVRREQGV